MKLRALQMRKPEHKGIRRLPKLRHSSGQKSQMMRAMSSEQAVVRTESRT